MDERLRPLYERDIEPGEHVFDPDKLVQPFWPKKGPTQLELSGGSPSLRWEGYQSWLRKQRGEPEPEPPKRSWWARFWRREAA